MIFFVCCTLGSGKPPTRKVKWMGWQNLPANWWFISPRNHYWMGKLNTVDLLVLTCLYHLIFIMKICLPLLKTSHLLMRRSTVLSLSFQLVFPDLSDTSADFLACWRGWGSITNLYMQNALNKKTVWWRHFENAWLLTSYWWTFGVGWFFYAVLDVRFCIKMSKNVSSSLEVHVFTWPRCLVVEP
jgi:hypothetical protein